MTPQMHLGTVLFITLQFAAACMVRIFDVAGGFWQNLGLYLFVFILPIFVFIRFTLREAPLGYLLLTENVISSLAKGAALGGFIVAVFLLVHKLSVQPIDSADNAVRLLGLVLVAPLEEIPFRGFYLKEFSKRFRFAWANLLQSLMFAAVHLQSLQPQELFRGVFLVAFGLWLGYLCRITKSLWPPILVHAAYNLSTMLFV